jgi:hypothetical protein
VAWALVAVLAGPAYADALDGASRPVQVVASATLWLGWTAVLIATLVPRASSLTAVRVGAPAPLAAAVVAAVHGPFGADDAVALTAGVVVAAAAVWPAAVDAFVDGSSYGSERRFALRTPPALLLAGAPAAWVLGVVVPATGLLLLAARAWVAGAVVLAVGVAGARLGVPALHRLSRRWLVFVPAGLVVHDHLALADPVLLRRPTFRALGPAPAGTTAHDLTLGAGGLPLELALGGEVDVPVARPLRRGRREAVLVRAGAFLVAPLRPGAVLAEARERRYPVTTAEPTTSSPA